MNQILNPTGPRPRRASELIPEQKMVWDIPSSFPRPNLIIRGNAPADVYSYRTHEGNVVCLVARYEFDDKKRFLQLTAWQAPDGEMNWYMKGMADNCPLFNVTQLVEKPDAPVIITEGEKCAIFAANAFPDYVCITSIGGSSAIAKTDFSILAERDVIILPDNDAPGEKAADAFTTKLREAGAARIRVLDIAKLSEELASPDTLTGFDIADAIECGVDANRFEDLLQDSEMVVDITVDESDLPKDPVLRELQTQYQLSPELPYDYDLTEDGIFKTEVDRKGQETVIFVGSPLAVSGRTTLPDGKGGWGYHVVLRSPDNTWSSLTLPGKLFASCGKEMRETLADAGFTPPQCPKGRRYLSEFISFWKDCPIIEQVEQVGWTGTSFALPEVIIQRKGSEKNIVLNLNNRTNLITQGGTFVGWQEIARLAEQCSRPTLAICCAFAATLLRLFNMKGGGFHLSGLSSRGKTTILIMAGSVWGGGGEDGFVRNWSMTTNGAEGLVTGHNDILLALDELTKVTPEQAAEVIYLLSNGHGKMRARKDGSSARSYQWRNLFLSTGERTISHQLALAGGKTRMTGGIDVRVADIPIEVSPGESFESFAPFSSAGEYVKKLSDLSRTHYGHAGPLFVRYIVDNPDAVDRAKVHFEEQRARLITPSDDPQIQRVADRFALVSAAGLIAIEAGILPMQPSSVIAAVATCFEAWKAQRGGNQSEEMLAARRHLRHFFNVHGPARFERLKGDSDEEDGLRPTADYPVRDRCGYRSEADDGAQVYYILPEAWKTEVCGIHSPQLMAKIARDAGALELGENDRLQKKVRLPDFPKGARLYVLRPDKLA